MDLFECPNTDHSFAFTKDRSTGGSNNIDADGDGMSGNYRFYTPDARDAPGLTGVTPRGLWHAGPGWDQAE